MSTVSCPLPSANPALPSAAELELLQQLAARFPWLFPGLDPRCQKTVGEVIDAYLGDAKGEIAARTHENRRRHLEHFRQAFGQRKTVELSPFEVKQWIMQNAGRYRSASTRAGVNVSLQRLFNWAVGLRVIKENPVKGLQLSEAKSTGRDMTPDEFQAIMRNTDAAFRRFLVALKLTGARPGELAALRWHHIDWQRGIAILPEHKTAKKTGRPRVIVFPPTGMKLLAWINRNHRDSCAAELQRILEASPGRQAKVREVVRTMRAKGWSYRSLYRARAAIGAKYRRVGGWNKHGQVVYYLPEDAKPQPPKTDHVFLCSKNCWPWKRPALGTKFDRLRKQLGLPASCKLYGLRHYFITQGVRNNVNLKALATLVGHSDTRMLHKVYAHIAGDYDFLHAAAAQATKGGAA